MEVIHWHSLQVVVMETIGDWAANEFMVSTFLDAIRLCPNARWIPGQVSWLSNNPSESWGNQLFPSNLGQLIDLIGANLLCPSATSSVGMWFCTSWTLAAGKWCFQVQQVENPGKAENGWKYHRVFLGNITHWWNDCKWVTCHLLILTPGFWLPGFSMVSNFRISVDTCVFFSKPLRFWQ